MSYKLNKFLRPLSTYFCLRLNQNHKQILMLIIRRTFTFKKPYEQPGKTLKLKESVTSFCHKTFRVLFLFFNSREEFEIYRNVIIKEKNWFWSSILLFDASILSQLAAIARTWRAAGRYRVQYWALGNALAASFMVRDNFCEDSYLYLLYLLCPLCLRASAATRMQRSWA